MNKTTMELSSPWDATVEFSDNYNQIPSTSRERTERKENNESVITKLSIRSVFADLTALFITLSFRSFVVAVVVVVVVVDSPSK